MLPGRVVSLERREQGSSLVTDNRPNPSLVLRLRVPNPGPACLSDGHWDQEIRLVFFEPGYCWVARLTGHSACGSRAIRKLGSSLVLWPLGGGAEVSLNPKTQATPLSRNQTSKLRMIHRWAIPLRGGRNEGFLSLPCSLGAITEHFKSFKASIHMQAHITLLVCTVAPWPFLSAGTVSPAPPLLLPYAALWGQD